MDAVSTFMSRPTAIAIHRKQMNWTSYMVPIKAMSVLNEVYSILNEYYRLRHVSGVFLKPIQDTE